MALNDNISALCLTQGFLNYIFRTGAGCIKINMRETAAIAKIKQPASNFLQLQKLRGACRTKDRDIQDNQEDCCGLRQE